MFIEGGGEHSVYGMCVPVLCIICVPVCIACGCVFVEHVYVGTALHLCSVYESGAKVCCAGETGVCLLCACEAGV